MGNRKAGNKQLDWVEGGTAEGDATIRDETARDPNETVHDLHEQENDPDETVNGLHEQENEQVNDPHEQEYEQVQAPSREQLILDLIHENPAITYHGAADILNVSYSTVRRGFQALRESGTIERIGSDRRGTWRILIPSQPPRE
ncbi:DeoR family transcriptional regulator [Bifidobacterium leontopitheci]|uniref:DeoR family transcriptional regulator n=1 Tax=Bifidobacterium leontopitheci TaxID=2650774 RepID=UPI00186AD16B|nr:DeoR family transcriptional regulator [Bifidobacterium leontopitheci]